MDFLDDHWLSWSDSAHCQCAHQQDLLRNTPCLCSSSAPNPFLESEGVQPAPRSLDPLIPERLPVATVPPDPAPSPPPVLDDAPVTSQSTSTPLPTVVHDDSEEGAPVPGNHDPLTTTVHDASEGGSSVPLAKSSNAPCFLPDIEVVLGKMDVLWIAAILKVNGKLDSLVS